MQVFFVGVIALIGLRHIMPGESSAGGALDAFCPFGGIETLWPYLSTGATLKTTNLLNFTILISVLGLSLVAGRAFCGWVCPLGTLQDMFASWARRLSGETTKVRGKKSKAVLPLQVPAKVDKLLRYLKYLVLVAILLASAAAVYPPLRNLCPVRAIFGFHWNSGVLGIVLLGFVISSMLVRRFSCKYLCPLGAALAISNKISPIRLHISQDNCSNCGRCDADCPMDIQPVPKNTGSLECVRCLECLQTCAKPDAINLSVGIGE